jgi:NADPH:quinone reductase-like Zn-dependent oxidoreductase
MKAIALREYGTVDNFEMTQIPIPDVQAAEVRIKIRAVSFNPVDYQIRTRITRKRPGPVQYPGEGPFRTCR